MKKRIISIVAALTTFVTLFTGFTSVSADYINDNILIEYARNNDDILTFYKGDTRNEFRYMLVDLSGDGNNELVVKYNQIDIFTVEDGTVKKILESQHHAIDAGRFIAYYNGEYYWGEDSYQGGNGRHKFLSRYVNGKWKYPYELHEWMDNETGAITYQFNGEPVSYETHNDFLENVIYGCQIPWENYKTLDELEAELKSSSTNTNDNDTVLKAFAQNGAEILGELNNYTDNNGLRYYLADLSGDGNNELIVTNNGYLLIYMNENGYVKLIGKKPTGHSGGYSFLNKYDGLYYLAWSSYSSWGFQSLSRYNNGQWDVIHSDLEDMLNPANYQINDEIVSREDYEEHSYNVIHSDVYAYNDFMTLDELLRGETPIKIYVYEERVRPDSNPVIVDGRTLVPIRAVAEALGYEVGWNQDEQRVTLSSDDTGKSVSVVIGDYSINTADKTVAIDVPAQILNDRTYIPLRAVTEALDCAVEWNGDERAVYIK